MMLAMKGVEKRFGALRLMVVDEWHDAPAPSAVRKWNWLRLGFVRLRRITGVGAFQPP